MRTIIPKSRQKCGLLYAIVPSCQNHFDFPIHRSDDSITRTVCRVMILLSFGLLFVDRRTIVRIIVSWIIAISFSRSLMGTVLLRAHQSPGFQQLCSTAVIAR
jgi:hypothetical protein